jgi:hypothetical protein
MFRISDSLRYVQKRVGFITDSTSQHANFAFRQNRILAKTDSCGSQENYKKTNF